MKLKTKNFLMKIVTNILNLSNKEC